MYYDFSRRSVGEYAIFATIHGSYGEHTYTQVGRNYRDVEHAAKAALKLHQAGARDVTLKNLKTKKVCYIEMLEAQLKQSEAKAPKVKGVVFRKRHALHAVHPRQ